MALVDGHEDLDWEALRRWRGTLVVLMGVATLRRTCEGLSGLGWRADLPAAVIERASGPGQRTTTGTLGDIADRAEAVGVRSPAVVVVGEVAALAVRDMAARPAMADAATMGP